VSDPQREHLVCLDVGGVVNLSDFVIATVPKRAASPAAVGRSAKQQRTSSAAASSPSTTHTVSVSSDTLRNPSLTSVKLDFGGTKSAIPQRIRSAVCNTVAQQRASLKQGLQIARTGMEIVGFTFDVSGDYKRTSGRFLEEGAVAVSLDLAEKLAVSHDIGIGIDGKKWILMGKDRKHSKYFLFAYISVSQDVAKLPTTFIFHCFS